MQFNFYTMSRKILVVTGGGDCPGLNAVIRGIVKSAASDGDWEVFGCIESFNGLLKDEIEIVPLTERSVAGIHVQGGTIIKTTNHGGPFQFPVRQSDGSWKVEDRSQLLKKRLEDLGIECVVNIGGDGSQRISLALSDLGVPIVGVPKTIDNDLSSTDFRSTLNSLVQCMFNPKIVYLNSLDGELRIGHRMSVASQLPRTRLLNGLAELLRSMLPVMLPSGLSNLSILREQAKVIS